MRRYAHGLKELIRIGQGEVACAWFNFIMFVMYFARFHIEEILCGSLSGTKEEFEFNYKDWHLELTFARYLTYPKKKKKKN